MMTVALAEAGAELAHRLLGDLAGRHHAPRRLRRLELATNSSSEAAPVAPSATSFWTAA
jgi:hypothetical protein